MNLYLIHQSKVGGYDTYDSAVVAAPNEGAARLTHPGSQYHPDFTWERHSTGVWATNPADVKVELIGKAGKNVAVGIVCASFNAG